MSLVRFAADYIRDVAVHDFHNDRRHPSFINFSVSNRCNAKCVMCDIWRYKSQDATGNELQGIFTNPYLHKIRDFGITGGEPFIRADITNVIEQAITNIPNLRQIAITTNGFNTERIKATLPKMIDLVRPKSIKLLITVSVDGLGETHNQSRGVPNVWDKVKCTLDYIQKLKDPEISLSTACTISRVNANIEQLQNLDTYMKENKIPIIYRLAVYVSRIYNNELMKVWGISPETPEARAVTTFLKEVVSSSRYSGRSEFYNFIIAYLSGHYNIDTIPDNIRPRCKEQYDGGMLDSNGDLYVCSVSGQKIGNVLTDQIEPAQIRAARKLVREKHCKSCMHDHAIHPRLQTLATALSERMGFRATKKGKI
ncbi:MULTISPECIES: radical SAM protein [Thalassospira]|uniref:Radical SAM core domain-containing protein n=2 Tax=Thalassospira TaxID=168934 RepID=A0A367VZI5_9PROT|nr:MULTISPECIES: radical SAM protein [Thalassospira]MDG4720120.1 radical SAM protein [Thalassospira sp. FZY0004]RCK31761.1 hypothetical protein TH19_20285 [Thalassospira profundimaris]